MLRGRFNIVGGLHSNSRGVALVEFALVAPLFLLILLGIFAYGGYFWRAHALQQVANDAARSAIAGLTPAERLGLARDTVATEIGSLAGLHADRATIGVSEGADTIRVELSYDAANDVFFSLGLVPMPASLIRRSAAVKLGGL